MPTTRLLMLPLIAFMLGTTATTAASGPINAERAGIQNRVLINAPPGFNESCMRYAWLCEDRFAGAASMPGEGLLRVARLINDQVNRSVTSLSDPENFGVSEYWSLPTNGNGDCEDYVLDKYKRLLDAGVDSRHLNVAVVLDRNGDNHAVLILHHPGGDLVLDSLNPEIKPWNETGYRFLAMQVSAEKTLWEVVAGRSRAELTLARR